MKKILASLLVAVSFSAMVQAQTDKGDWMVGGSLSLNTTEGATSFSFQPNAGYFFAKGFVAGSELLISTSKLGDIRTTSLGVGPFARYYFELKEPQFKPYVHAGVSVASVRTKAFGMSETETAVGFLLGLGGAYFINDNVAIDGLAGYNHTKVENSEGNGGFLFRIGFQVHLLGSEVGGK
jgi:outer membrane protein W